VNSKSCPGDAEPKLSPATAQRLSQYLRYLRSVARHTTISSEELARHVGIQAAQIRRDLATLGHLGQRGVGYDRAGLTEAIRAALGIHREWRTIVVGIGNLARALLRYKGFEQQGFQMVGLVDSDPSKIGLLIEGLPVRGLDELPLLVQREGAELAILTVPPEAAPQVAEKIAAAGIRGILNFAPTSIRTMMTGPLPIVSVDLAIQLEQLAYQVQSRPKPDEPAARNSS